MSLERKKLNDGLRRPAIEMRAHQLLSTVCVAGGAACPLIEKEEAERILERVRRDPTTAIRLTSDADEIPHYSVLTEEDYAEQDRAAILNRKRDLDVLQRLGLAPGDTRRARYLYTLLFERIETLQGVCAYDTPGWEGCPLAASGAYERMRAKGWKSMTYARSAEEMAEFRRRNAARIEKDDKLYMRPHHLMCLCCWAGKGGDSPRPNDSLYEIGERIRRDPDVLIVLVEGCCEACDCCDGFHPETGRCVHAGGLIRDYKKDLDVLQKLGLMPGDAMKAGELFKLLYARVASTTDICGYGDDVVTSHEWSICGGPGGNSGYLHARESGLFASKS